MGIISYAAQVTSSGIASNRHIDGYVKKHGSGSFIYPVGDGGFYRPFAAESNGIIGTYFFENPTITSNEVIGGPFPVTSKDVNIGAVSEIEFWDINGTFSGKITLTWNSISNIGSLVPNSDLSKLLLVGWNGSKWTKIESEIDASSILGGASTISGGSITTSEAIVPDSYKIYTLAAEPAGALPVTLVDFKVNALERSAELKWITSSEINSDHFEIERSATGKSWISVGIIPTKSASFTSIQDLAPLNYTFHDIGPLSGDNFYRLKMIDTDGSFAYSKICLIRFNTVNEVSIYPNPVSDRLFISDTGMNKITEVLLLDASGKTILCQSVIAANGISVDRFLSGIYIVTIKRNDGSMSSQKIIINR